VAIEKDPAQPTREPQKPKEPEPIAAAPATDAEKEALRAELAQHKQAMNELAQMVQAGRVKILDQPEKKEEPEEDDSALVDRKELKRHFEDLKKSVAGAVIETTVRGAKQIRDANIEILKSQNPKLQKYEAEVKSILERMPDQQQASHPDTIKQVLRVVQSNHQTDEEAEIRREERAKFRQELAAKGIDLDEEEESPPDDELDQDERQAKVGPARGESRAPRGAGGVAPSGDASASRYSSRTARSVPPLSRDEKVIAEQFGIESAEEFRRLSDKNWKPDTTGFHGKTRI